MLNRAKIIGFSSSQSQSEKSTLAGRAKHSQSHVSLTGMNNDSSLTRNSDNRMLALSQSQG